MIFMQSNEIGKNPAVALVRNLGKKGRGIFLQRKCYQILLRSLIESDIGATRSFLATTTKPDRRDGNEASNDIDRTQDARRRSTG